MTDAVKRTLLAMALLLTSVFSATGCGSDDGEAPVESRIKNSTGDPALINKGWLPTKCTNDVRSYVADGRHLEEEDYRGETNKCGDLPKPIDPEDTDTDDNDDRLSDLLDDDNSDDRIKVNLDLYDERLDSLLDLDEGIDDLDDLDDLLDLDSLLPQPESIWSHDVPLGNGGLQEKSLLNAGHHVGVDTVCQSLSDTYMGMRSEPPTPQVNVSPWLQSTISPDLMRRRLGLDCDLNDDLDGG